MCVDMCIDSCAYICTDMCINMREPVRGDRAPRPVVSTLRTGKPAFIVQRLRRRGGALCSSPPIYKVCRNNIAYSYARARTHMAALGEHLRAAALLFALDTGPVQRRRYHILRCTRASVASASASSTACLVPLYGMELPRLILTASTRAFRWVLRCHAQKDVCTPCLYA